MRSWSSSSMQLLKASAAVRQSVTSERMSSVLEVARSRGRLRPLQPFPRRRDRTLARLSGTYRTCVYRIQYLNVYRQIMGANPRPKTPPLEVLDDPTDIMELDPELALVVKQMQSERARGGSAAPDTGGPPVVSITVKWIPHPKDPSTQGHTETFRVKRVSNRCTEPNSALTVGSTIRSMRS